jgi:hypothetical protein
VGRGLQAEEGRAPQDDDHDFYVLPAQTGSHRTYQVVARAIPVLVHNCGNEVGTQVDYSDTGNDLVNATRNQRLADGRSLGGPGRGNYGALLDLTTGPSLLVGAAAVSMLRRI